MTSSSSQIAARTSSSSSPPIQIPEIPPFKKRDNQSSTYPYPPNNNSNNTPSTSVSPPKVPDIPPFNKQRKSKDFVQSSEQQSSLDSSSIIGHPEHQLTIGSHGAEWTKRLKVAAEQSPIHRSTDCIASKDLGTSSDSELLKPAPSWTNVALKTTEQAGTSKKIKKKNFFI
jgi:anoctamin-8